MLKNYAVIYKEKSLKVSLAISEDLRYLCLLRNGMKTWQRKDQTAKAVSASAAMVAGWADQKALPTSALALFIIENYIALMNDRDEYRICTYVLHLAPVHNGPP